MAKLASVEQAKVYVKSKRSSRDDSLTTEEEQMLGLLLDAFEPFLIERTGRKVFPEPAFVGDPPLDTAPPVTKTFTYPIRGDLRVPDLREIVSVTLGGMTLTNLDDWLPTWELTQKEGHPATHFRLINAAISPVIMTRQLAITGRWGYTGPAFDDDDPQPYAVPGYLRHALLLMVARAYKKRDANYADNVQSGQTGDAFTYYKSLPEEVKMMIDTMRVPKFAFAG